MSFLRMAAKQSPLILADALGEADDEGLEDEVGPVGDDQLVGVGEPEQALFDEALALADLELLHDEALQPRRHRRLDLEPDDDAAAAPLQRRSRTARTRSSASSCTSMSLSRSTRNAPWLLHPEAGEQARDEHADHRLEPDEADRLLALRPCSASG